MSSFLLRATLKCALSCGLRDSFKEDIYVVTKNEKCLKYQFFSYPPLAGTGMRVFTIYFVQNFVGTQPRTHFLSLEAKKKTFHLPKVTYYGQWNVFFSSYIFHLLVTSKFTLRYSFNSIMISFYNYREL